MGTFHDDKGELHGITVIVDTNGPAVYVGQCDTVDEVGVKLTSVDVHNDGDDGKSKVDYLERAKKFGTWNRHARFTVPAAEVKSVRKLAEWSADGEAVARQAEGSAPPQKPVEVVVQSEIVALTQEAVDEVKRLTAAPENSGKGLRLKVVGGGCSGLSYALEFDGKTDGDMVGDHLGFSVYIDRKSAVYLRGVTLDHQGGLNGKGFVFHNPNASSTCGCGESFSL